jgi:hypothetical protein
LLEQDFESDDYWLAVEKFRGAGAQFVWDFVCLQMASQNTSVQRCAVDVLAQIQGRDETKTVNILIEVLSRATDVQVIFSCLAALGHQYYHTQPFFHAIARFCNHADSEVRFTVATACPNSKGGEKAVEALIGLMEDSVAKVRDWATFGLRGMTDYDSDAIREAFVKRLIDEDTDTVFEAIEGLAFRHDLRSLQPLLQKLDSGWLTDTTIDASKFLLDLDDTTENWEATDFAKALREKFPSNV